MQDFGSRPCEVSDRGELKSCLEVVQKSSEKCLDEMIGEGDAGYSYRLHVCGFNRDGQTAGSPWLDQTLENLHCDGWLKKHGRRLEELNHLEKGREYV
jgi:hypothetical protein